MAEPLKLLITVEDRGTPVLKHFASNVNGAAQAMEHKGGAAAASMQAKLGGLTTSLGLSVKSLLAWGGAAGTAAAAGAAVVGAVKSMAAFQATMANVSTLVDTSKVSMEGLRKELLALDPALGSSKELAEGLYEALSAGVEPAKAVAFVGDAAKLAKAGLTDTKTAVDVLTTALNAYGLKAEQTGRVSDVMFKTVEIGKTTMEELAQQMGAAIPLAAQLNIPLEDLGASIATLTAGGMQTATAVDSMKSAFSNFITNAEKFRAVGIDVQKVLSEEGITGLLRKMQEATGGNAEKLQVLVSDIQGFSAVLGLAGKQADKFREAQDAMRASSGATDTAFKKQQATLDATWTRFLNSLDRILQEYAPPLLAFLTTLVRALDYLLVPLKPIIAALTGLVTMGKFLLNSLGPLAPLVKDLGNEAAIAALKEQELAKGTQATAQASQGAAAANTQLATSATAAAAGTQAAAGAMQDQAGAAAGAGAMVTTLAEKYSMLGVQATAEMQKAAQAMVEAFVEVKGRADVPIEALLQSFLKVRDTVLKAYGEVPAKWQGIFDEMLKTAEVFGIQIDKEASAQSKALQEAYKELGMKSSDELRAAADKSLQAFQLVADGGKATASALLDAWVDVALKQQDAWGRLSDEGSRYTRELANNALKEFLKIQASGQASAAEIEERWKILEGQFARLGLQLPEHVKPAFLQMAADGKQAADELTQSFRATEEAIKLGFTSIADKSRVELSRIQADWINQNRTLLEEWRNTTYKLSGLNDPATTIEGFDTPFATDAPGLQNQLQDFQQWRAQVAGGAGVYGENPALRASQLVELDRAIAQITRRLEEVRLDTAAPEARLAGGFGLGGSGTGGAPSRASAPAGYTDATGRTWPSKAEFEQFLWFGTINRQRVGSGIMNGPVSFSNNPYGFDFETNAHGAMSTFRGQTLRPGGGEVLLDRSLAEGLRDLVRQGGGKRVAFNSPRFEVHLNGIDPRALHAKQLVTALLPELREAVRRGLLEV